METAMHVYQYLEQEQNFNIRHALVTNVSDEYFYREDSYPHRLEVLSRYEPFASAQTPPFVVPDWIASMFTDDTTGVDLVIDAINEGVGLALHRNHGSQVGWGTPGFVTDEFYRLNNGNKLPVVFSINCLTGTFNYNEGDCFTEALLKHENGGAVGAIGATDLSYSGPNDILVHGIYDCFYGDYDPEYSDFNNSTSMRPAEALNYGKLYFYNYYGDSGVFEITMNEFNWFGDPELAMRTKTPEPLDVTYNDTVITYSATNYTVHVEKLGSPVERARVCVSKSDLDDYWVGITDNSGDLTFNNFTLNEVGGYTLVVTETDAIPFDGIIDSIVDGPYARVVSPLNNSAAAQVPEFIDIQWMSGSGYELDLSTIDVNDMHINGMTITGVQDLGNNVFRYNIIGIPQEGRVDIIVQENQVADLIGKNNPEQRFLFIYDLIPPQALLVYPNTEIVYQDLGYIDISWVDPDGSGIDRTTVDQTDITMDGVVFDSDPVRVAGNVWRYYYQGALEMRSYTINIGNQVVSDKALNFNEEASFLFSYEYPVISVTPSQIDQTLELGDIMNIPITISNIGGGTLTWNNHTVQYDQFFNEPETKGDLLKSFQYPVDLGQLCGITTDGYYVWILNTAEKLYKLDPGSGERVLSLDISSFAPGANQITYDGEYLWIASNYNAHYKLYQVNTETGEEMKEIDAPFYVTGLSYGDNSLWVMKPFKSTVKGIVYQINPDNGDTISIFELNEYLDDYTWDLAYSDDYLWFSSYNNVSNTIYKVDRYTGEIIDSFPAPGVDRSQTNYLDSDYQSNLWIGSFRTTTIFLVKSGEEERHDWLTVSPQSGETVKEESSIVTLNINTRYLTEDIYQGKLLIQSDSDNQYNVVEVPINVTIDGITNGRFTITALPGTGGSIDPPGSISIGFTETFTYSIIPDFGYRIEDVLVDGISVGAVSSYTFSRVNADQTISAVFDEIPIIELSQESVQIDASPDQVITTTMDIRNIGLQTLDWKAITQNNDAGSGGDILKSFQYSYDLGQIYGVTSDGAYIWVLSLVGILHKLDPESGESILSFDINSFASGANQLTCDGKYLWVAGNDNKIFYQINPETGEKMKEVDYPYGISFVSGLAYGNHSLWVMAPFKSTVKGIVYQVDPDDGSIISTVELDENLDGTIYDLAYTYDYLWFSSYNNVSNTIYKVDRYTGEIIDSFPAPGSNYSQTNYLDSDYQSNLWIGGLGTRLVFLVKSGGGNWLSLSPFSGETAPQQSSEVTFTIDTSGLSAGDYSSTLIIESNSHDQNHVIEVPVNLTITGTTIEEFTITTIEGTGGSISPKGPIPIRADETITFSITADEEYQISDVLVNTISVGAVDSYTFSNVDSDQTIEAVFEIIPIEEFTITTIAGAGGSISPQGPITIRAGETVTFLITADPEYQISDVLVNNISVGTVESYTFSNVNADQTIEAVFEVIPFPSIELSQGSFQINASPDEVITETLTITNTGDEILDWKTSTQNNDPASLGELLKTMRYPGDLGQLIGITSNGSYVWMLNSTGILHKLDTESGESVLSFDVSSFAPNARGLTYDGVYLWIASNSNHKLYQVNPETGEKMKEINSPFSNYVFGLAYGDNTLWVMKAFSNTERVKVYQVNPDTGETISTVELTDYLDNHTYDLAYTHDYLWFSSYNNTSNIIYKVDRYTGEIIDSFPAPGSNYSQANYLDSDYQSNLWIGGFNTRSIFLAKSAGGNWLSSLPFSGDTAPQQTSEVTLTIDTSGLTAGDYSGTLIIESNSQNQYHVIEVPVNLTIDNIPSIQLSQESFQINAVLGEVMTETLTINNTGDEILD